MALELDKDKLLAHLKAELDLKWEARFDRPREIGETLFGPSLTSDGLSNIRKVYGEAYWEGIVDAIGAILTFDDDLRGVEALAAFLKSADASEG